MGGAALCCHREHGYSLSWRDYVALRSHLCRDDAPAVYSPGHCSSRSGAILGDNLGYWVGRKGGFRLLRRYGSYIRLNERKLKLGLYLFRKHGGKVVFFGRFVAVLRAWAAFLAGTNRMPWPSFLLFNALGGITWATVYGLGGYFLGESIHQLAGPVGTITIVLATFIIIASLVFVWRNEQQLEEKAEKALPGPLEAYSAWEVY